MSGAAQLYSEYASFHNDPRNRVCHEIGIPLIVLSIFALLELVRVGPLDLGLVAGASILIYYFILDAKTAALALVAFALLYFAGRFVTWQFAIGAFAVGWIFQFAGHGYEGREPAFLTNVVHLLVGPLWICSLLKGFAK